MFIRNHKILTIFCLLIFVSSIYMAFTGTLSYPYIMVDRQIQSIRDCTFGSTTFSTDLYGLSFSVPDGYCVLPNRLFPRDGSIEIVPRGWYFVFNEYAFGTIANGSEATLLFEPITSERDPDIIISNLVKGKFLNMADVTSTTTSSGVKFILAKNVYGTDDELYDWDFVVQPDRKHFVAIVGRHLKNQNVRDYLIQTLSFR